MHATPAGLESAHVAVVRNAAVVADESSVDDLFLAVDLHPDSAESHRPVVPALCGLVIDRAVCPELAPISLALGTRAVRAEGQEAARIGVAIGNSPAEIKARANRILMRARKPGPISDSRREWCSRRCR